MQPPPTKETKTDLLFGLVNRLLSIASLCKVFKELKIQQNPGEAEHL